MPEEEFDLYLSLMSKLLRLSPQQKASIENELRDHIEERFAELVVSGLTRDEAVRQALEEFGDAAGLAGEFTKLARRNLRRRIMRWTAASAAIGAIVILAVNAFLPEHPGVPAPHPLVGQDADAATAGEPLSTAVVVEGEGDVVRIDPATFLPAALGKPISLEFVENPLGDVMDFLSEETGLVTMIDEPALSDVGVSTDSTISISVEDLPVYLALDRILFSVDNVELAWLLEDDILHVTTRELADDQQFTISYNVRDLLKREIKFEDLLDAMLNQTSGPWFDLDGIGGTASVFGDLMVVRQSRTMQREVAALLAALRSPGPERRCLESPLDAELERKLDQPAFVDFVEVPLADAVAMINDQYGARLWIDEPSLADVAVSGDTLVTLTLSDRPLRTVLKYLVGNIDGVECAATVDRGGLRVTTREIADDTMRTVVYDVSDIVGGDIEKTFGLIEVLQNQTSGPWFDLDGIGCTIQEVSADLLVVRQTERMRREIGALLAQPRAAIRQASEDGASPELENRFSESLETRYYSMDAETANDLALLLPEQVASETWASTVDADGQIVQLSAEGVGVIRRVASGRRLIELSRLVAAQRADDGAAPDGTESDPPDMLVIPQSVLIITHKRSVQRQIGKRLWAISESQWSAGSGDQGAKFISSGIHRAGTRGGFDGGDGGGFFSITE